MDRSNNEQWREIIYRGVESDTLDYKYSMNWIKMSRQSKGKLVRHCLAFANTQGGCIVIGVGEDKSGHPSVYRGLSNEETHSFDPSIVGTFINSCVDPAIDLTIERPLIDNRRYAIIVVRPFKDLPHVCIDAIEGELQRGVFYIRTPDASSRPAYRSSEMHLLIQRALRNQREVLEKMLRGLLYDGVYKEDVLANGADFSISRFREEQFHDENFFRRHVVDQVDCETNEVQAGAGIGVNDLILELSARPLEYQLERFTLSAVKGGVVEALQEDNIGTLVNHESIADGYFTNTAFRILDKDGGKMLQCCRSGLVHFIAVVRLDDRILRHGDQNNFIQAFIQLAGRIFAQLGLLEEKLQIECTLKNTENLELRRNEEAEQESKLVCRIPDIKVTQVLSVKDLNADYSAHAQYILREIYSRFNPPDFV